MNEILLEFAGRQADAGAAALPESYKQLIVNAAFFLKTRMSGCALAKRLKDITGFRLNLNKGRVVFAFNDVPEIAVDAQVISAYSDDGSWMWGWGHPDVSLELQHAALAVQQFGERQEIEELMNRGG